MSLFKGFDEGSIGAFDILVLFIVSLFVGFGINYLDWSQKEKAYLQFCALNPTLSEPSHGRQVQLKNI